MNTRRWYRKKRLMLPLCFFGAFVVAIAVAVVRASISQIIVYNESGVPLKGLRLSACDQTFDVGEIRHHGSYRIYLGSKGKPGEITINGGESMPLSWHGGYIEPSGGWLISLRVLRDGEVMFHDQISWWRQFE
jgi:hypothetical protein